MKIMTTTIITGLALVIMSFSDPHGELKDGSYEIDSKKSIVIWNGKKVTGEHSGTIQLKTGELVIADGKLSGGTFEIDMTTIDVTDLEGEWKDKLNNHLKSEDFFGVKKFPTATLAITKVTANGSSGDYKVMADLTIKSTTKQINFDAHVHGEGSLSATAEITIDRSEYDVRYGSGSFFDNLGDKTIYDDFILKINLATK